jgi:death-on-curing protein
VTAASDPEFLSVDEVRLLHSLSILEFGGSSGLRASELLDSARAQPRAMFGGSYLHERPFGMAAAYAFHLCQNHPFVDGNKRVAWAAMRSFLFREGYQLRVDTDDAVATMLLVAIGELQKDALSVWIAERAQSRPRLELRDFFKRLKAPELITRLQAIADSYHSGGPAELAAIVDDAATAIPVISHLATLYQLVRSNNEQAIHYIQLLAALHRIAEEHGYEW